MFRHPEKGKEMKVKDAIKRLKQLDPQETIALAYYTGETMGEALDLDSPVPEQVMNTLLNKLEDQFPNGCVYRTAQYILDGALSRGVWCE